MEINEIIALAVCAFIVLALAVYEGIMHRSAQLKIREARESASAWKRLYNSVEIERDLLQRRVSSAECQKELFWQQKLADAHEELQEARNEIRRLEIENETYKRQLDRKPRKAAAGSGEA